MTEDFVSTALAILGVIVGVYEGWILQMWFTRDGPGARDVDGRELGV